MRMNVWSWFAAVLAATAVICTLFAGTASPVPYAYDESDYMYAGAQGFVANYTDRGAMSLFEFVNKGLELSRDKTRRVSMSQYVRSIGDISFYRHYHGPVYAYWIAFGDALGIDTEAGYRASGLILHALAAIAIFWLFLKTFPQFPVASAFVAALMFVANRTTLSAGTTITQHIVYEVVSILTLFALALYLQTRNIRWWYATAACAAVACASVEIGAVLVGAILLSIAISQGRDWRSTLSLAGKGTLVFIATLFLIWPKSVLHLNFVKGYLYLAYMAIYRKTFTPIGPVDLWGFRIQTYPLEFVLPLVVLISIPLFWKKLGPKPQILPFLVYGLMFFVVTTVVTLPYTYYHGSLLAATAVLTGIAYGELSNRIGTAGQRIALALVVGSLVMLDVSFYQETRERLEDRAFTRDVLDYLEQSPSIGPTYTPFAIVPTLHYYRPDLAVVGYDEDWTLQRLADESLNAAPARVLCAESMCPQLAALWPEEINATLQREPAGREENGETVFALSLKR